jgi:hypothetical protein
MSSKKISPRSILILSSHFRLDISPLVLKSVTKYAFHTCKMPVTFRDLSFKIKFLENIHTICVFHLSLSGISNYSSCDGTLTLQINGIF